LNSQSLGHPGLRRVIDAAPSKHLTFLLTESVTPLSVTGFGNWFRALQ
jgi:hypothetical protein